MIDDVTAGGVFWNEAHRLPKLLMLLKATFANVAVVIQESTDDSLKIAQSMLGDRSVRVDRHHGAGDPSFPMLLRSIKTPWTFIVSGDEMPSQDLLDSLPEAVLFADRLNLDGLWISFRSSIDGYDFTSEQDGHLRLFKTSLGWPNAKLHSGPKTDRVGPWIVGHISHDRSLDEMMRDYLRYWEMGKGDAGWEAHNRLMMHDACAKVADLTSWEYIKSHEWWPEVKAIAFPE